MRSMPVMKGDGVSPRGGGDLELGGEGIRVQDGWGAEDPVEKCPGSFLSPPRRGGVGPTLTHPGSEGNPPFRGSPRRPQK